MYLSQGILTATEYQKRCLQLNLLMSDVRGSEDCLYLNIWVPQGSTGKAAFDKELITVHVYTVHGSFCLCGGRTDSQLIQSWGFTQAFANNTVVNFDHETRVFLLNKGICCRKSLSPLIPENDLDKIQSCFYFPTVLCRLISLPNGFFFYFKRI